MSRGIKSSTPITPRNEQMGITEHCKYPAPGTRVDIDQKRYHDDKTIQIEVLEEKIKIDSKNHELEMRKIMTEKDEIVKCLEVETDCLKIEVANKDDKIRQLDIANDKKEFLLIKNDQKIKELQQERDRLNLKADDLQREISRLEDTQREMSEKYEMTVTTVKKQEDEIKMMKINIDDLKKQLAVVTAKRDAKDEELLSHMKSMKAEIEYMNKDAQRNHQQMNEQLCAVLKEIKNCKEDIREEMREIAMPKHEGVTIAGSKNLTVQTGDRFYISQTPCRKPETSARGVALPQIISVSFPSSTRSSTSTGSSTTQK